MDNELRMLMKLFDPDLFDRHEERIEDVTAKYCIRDNCSVLGWAIDLDEDPSFLGALFHNETRYFAVHLFRQPTTLQYDVSPIEGEDEETDEQAESRPWVLYIFDEPIRQAVYQRFSDRYDAIRLFESWSNGVSLDKYDWYQVYY